MADPFTFSIAHHSSRFDKGNLRDGFRKTAQYTNLAAWTEMGSDSRSNTLQDEADKNGWGYWRPTSLGPDECALTYKRTSWKLLETGAKQLTTIRWTGDDDKENRPLYANAAWLQHKSSGKKLIYSYAHMPSSVFSCKDGWSSNNKAKAYKDAMPNWVKWVKALDDKWGQAALVISADWNMDMACDAARKYLEGVWPDNYKVAGSNSGGVWPDTHDTRTIDWFILGGAVSKNDPISVYSMPDSDHKTAVGKFKA